MRLFAQLDPYIILIAGAICKAVKSKCIFRSITAKFRGRARLALLLTTLSDTCTLSGKVNERSMQRDIFGKQHLVGDSASYEVDLRVQVCASEYG